LATLLRELEFLKDHQTVLKLESVFCICLYFSPVSSPSDLRMGSHSVELFEATDRSSFGGPLLLVRLPWIVAYLR